MTNRKTKTKRPSNKPKKATPFADAGKIVGTAAGKFFGIPGFRDIGSLVGSGIGRIFGSGDYTVVGPQPNFNVLTGQIPKFSTTKATNIVCHREYITDITGTTAFTNNVYPIQPGDSTTFPWLANIAKSYSQYRIHGMVFEFRPLITDYVTSGAPGVLIMSTNYNADDDAFTTKRQMENSEFAVSCKPTEKLLHLIECDPKQTSINELYTRTGALPTGDDYKTYDMGNFQIATQGNPNQLLGELWVTYCVEFFKPEVPVAGSGLLEIVRTTSSGSTYDFGTNTLSAKGSIAYTSTSTVLTMTGLTVNNAYLINFWLVCSGTISTEVGPDVTTGTQGNYFSDSTAANSTYPAHARESSRMIYTRIAKPNSSGTLVLTIAGTGTFSAPCAYTTQVNVCDLGTSLH